MSSGLQPPDIRVSAHSQDPLSGFSASPGPHPPLTHKEEVGGGGGGGGGVDGRGGGRGGNVGGGGGGGGGGVSCPCVSERRERCGISWEGRRGLRLRGGGVAGNVLSVLRAVSSSSSRLAVAAWTRTACRT